MGTRKYGILTEEWPGAGRIPADFAISGMGKGSTNLASVFGFNPGAADAGRVASAVRQAAWPTKVRRVILHCNRASLVLERRAAHTELVRAAGGSLERIRTQRGLGRS